MLVAGGTTAGVGATVGDGDTLGGLTDVPSGSSGAFSSLEAAPPPTLLLRLDRPSAPPGESTGLSAASLFFFLDAEVTLSSSSLTGDGAVTTMAVVAAVASVESSVGEALGVVGVVGSALDAGAVSSRPLFLPFVGVSGFVFFFLSLSAVLAAGDLRPPSVARLLAVSAPSMFSGLAASPPMLLPPCLLRPFVWFWFWEKREKKKGGCKELWEKRAAYRLY